VRQVAAGPGGIPLGDLVPCGEALLGRQARRHRDGAAVLAGAAPVGEPHREVRERVTEGRQLPVHHCGHHGYAAGLAHEGVVQPEVTVHQRGLAVCGALSAERVEELGHALDVAGATGLPLGGPAPQLPLDVAVGAAEVAQAGRVEVDLVDPGEDVDELLRQGPTLCRAELGGLVRLAVDDAVDLGHGVERRTDDVGVVAQREHPRHRDVSGAQGGHHTVLPRHVVCARQQLPERGSSDDDRVLPAADAVGQVGQAAGDDLGGPVVAEPGESAAGPGREGLPGQAGRLRAGGHAVVSLAAMRSAARRAARLARDILWTSVAPS